MEFVRKVVNGTDLKDIIDIPNDLVHRKVEVLVFPINEQNKKRKTKKSLSGFLSKYANSSLIGKEENAWLEEAKE